MALDEVGVDSVNDMEELACVLGRSGERERRVNRELWPEQEGQMWRSQWGFSECVGLRWVRDCVCGTWTRLIGMVVGTVTGQGGNGARTIARMADVPRDLRDRTMQCIIPTLKK